jgi:hypothetical protein
MEKVEKLKQNKIEINNHVVEDYLVTDESRARFLKKFSQLKKLDEIFLDSEVKRKRVKELQDEIRELDLKIQILGSDVKNKKDSEGEMILEGLKGKVANKNEELNQLRLLIKQEESN